MINEIEIKCNLETLVKVLNATGNPTVAIQMLNGEYKTPCISREKIGDWETKKYNTVITNNLGEEESVEMEEKVPVIYTFESYCPFKDKVTYVVNDGYIHTDDMSLDRWCELESPYRLAM